MKKLVIVAALCTTACVNQPTQEQLNTFNNIINTCDETSVNENYGNCVKSGLDEQLPNWDKDEDAKYIYAYIQWLNAAGARVGTGEMTVDAARFGAKELRGRLRAQSMQEKQYKRQQQDANFAAFFAGIAVMSAAQPAYNYNPPPNTTTYTYPGRRPISCTTIGNVVSCI